MTYWPTETKTLLIPLKFACAMNPEILAESTDPDFDFDYIDISSVSLEAGVTEKATMLFRDAPSRARKPVKAGDIIISTVRTYLKAVAYIDERSDGNVVSTGFAVLRPNAASDPRYLYRVAQSHPFIEAVVAASTGVSYPAINPSTLGNIEIPLPDLATQKAIAAFLDAETARIDTLIEKKERQVAGMFERHRAQVAAAVSGQLSGAAEFRDTGIGWANRVPADWKVLRLRRLFESAVYGISESLSDSGAVAVLRMGNIQDGKVICDGLGFVDHVDPALTLRNGDLLFNRTNSRDLVGKVGLYRGDYQGVLSFASYLVRIRPSKLTFSEYLNVLINSEPVLFEARGMAIPSISQSNLNPNRYGSIKVPIPPLAEQRRLAELVGKSRELLDAVTVRVQASIARLREFRAALITAAVTGQIDPAEWRRRGEGDRRLDRIAAETAA